MPNINLNIPILVQQQSGQTFVVRPLFLPFPLVHHHRFDKAIGLFKGRVKQMFKGFPFGRDNMEILYWYHFTPKFQFKRFSFQFLIKSHHITGNFSVAYFELDGKIFLSFPGFDNYMAMIDPPERGKSTLKAEVEEILRKLLLQELQLEGEDFDPEHYLAYKREFVSSVTQEISLSEEAFKFDQRDTGFSFQFFRRSPTFIGEVELLKVGYSLNEQYPHQLRRAYLREELVGELSQAIFYGNNTPFVLVGPEGVGRHSILEEALYRYLDNEFAQKSQEQKIWYLDPTRIISGMSVVGMWEKRLEAILAFIKTTGRKGLNDKLLIDNPVALPRIGQSANNKLVMSHVLKPYLERREIQVLLIATPEEWKLIQEKDRSFTDLFQVVRIQEPTHEEAFRMVMEQRKILEKNHECQFTIQAIMHLFSTYRNFFRNKALPGVIVKWMQQFAVKYQMTEIDFPQVLAEFEGISGFQELLLDSHYTFEKGEVEENIGRQLVGQESAVAALADSIHLIKARLNNPSKPLASYLFIGPTGVGKTQGAKVLSEFLMGNTRQLIRFDMNEYVDYYAADRLVGNYYQPEGQLISKVRYQPFGILLLDEIEKAHRSVHDLLLQVLDDGRLTDGRGRTVDFSNTIIIMTSNLGAKEVSARMGFNQNDADEAAIYEKEVRNFFRPEFVNRIDRIVVFNPLRLPHILDIARLQIEELLQRDGFVRRTTMVNIDPEALDWVARRGFDSRMGGRALKRQIERDLTTLTAEQLIESKADSPVLFDISFEKEKLKPRITTLDFAPPLPPGWIPEFPAEEKARFFYEKLLQFVDKQEQAIRRLSASSDSEEDVPLIIGGTGSEEKLNWVLYQAKDQARTLKERLQLLVLDFQEYRFQQEPMLPFRLKISQAPPRNWESMRQKTEDRFFEKESLQEIFIRYQHGVSRFDSSSTEMFQDFLNAAFLHLTRLAIQKKRLDKGYFLIESYMKEKGKDQIRQLLDWYQALMRSMNISCKTDYKKQRIEVEGYGVAEWFKAEAGIHLFFLAQEIPLPLMAYWMPEGSSNAGKKTPRTILRLYDETRTITDMRSGFTNSYQLSPGELKVLIYAGLPESLRNRLAPK